MSPDEPLSTAQPAPTPDISQLTTPLDLVAKHSKLPTRGLITLNRLRHALRNRATNGLRESGAVIETNFGRGLLIDEKKFCEWLLALNGLHRPRSRSKSRAKPIKSRNARAWRARRPGSSASAP